MHLVSALACGIRGAENGTATIYARGTTQRATWYEDFEATTQRTADVSLDSNGGAEVYVGQVVDVVVRDSSGLTVRTITEGANSGAVEVISQSFNGADYVTGATGPSKPTTVQSVLDLWKTTNGAVGWRFLYNGVATTLPAFAAHFTGLFFNVKDSIYGAQGDATTDDASAIQAAITAADTAGGGTVFFPAGTYRVNSGLTLPTSVRLMGSGYSSSVIWFNHASDTLFTVTSPSSTERAVIEGLKLSQLVASTGNLVSVPTTNSVVLVRDCSLRGAGGSTQPLISSGVGNIVVDVDSCKIFSAATGSAIVAQSVCNLRYCSCEVGAGASTSTHYAIVSGGTVIGNTFDMSSVTSGTFTTLQCSGSTSTTPAVVAFNTFIDSAAGTQNVVLRAQVYGNRRGTTVNYQPTGDTATDTFSNLCFNDLEHDYRYAVVSSSTHTIPDDVGLYTIEYTNASASPAIIMPKFVLGRRWTLVFHVNNAGGVAGIILAAGTGTSRVRTRCANATSPTWAANTYTVINFVGIRVNGDNEWHGTIGAYDEPE